MNESEDESERIIITDRKLITMETVKLATFEKRREARNEKMSE